VLSGINKNKARDKDFKALIGLSPELAVLAVNISINLVTSLVLWYLFILLRLSNSHMATM
jgi:hypothetical protein